MVDAPDTQDTNALPAYSPAPDGGAEIPEHAGDPGVRTALLLGWCIEDCHRRMLTTPGDWDPPSPQSLAELPALSAYDEQLVALDQVDFALAALHKLTAWPAHVTSPDTSAARAALERLRRPATDPPDGRGAQLLALGALHVSILIALTAADQRWGSAYELGRTLSAMTRGMQGPDDLALSFSSERVKQVRGWLGDLTSALPAHAAHAVGQSLDWWHDEVAGIAGVGGTAGRDRTRRAAEPPPARRAEPDPPWWIHTARGLGMMPTPRATRPNPREYWAALAAGAPGQGAMWRTILSGERRATEALEPDDYLEAGEQMAVRLFTLARRSGPAVWAALTVLAVVAAFVVYLLIWVVAGPPLGRTATGVATVAGALMAGWRVVRARALSALHRLEGPLWGAELDRVIADAITTPPVGRPDVTAAAPQPAVRIRGVPPARAARPVPQQAERPPGFPARSG